MMNRQEHVTSENSPPALTAAAGQAAPHFDRPQELAPPQMAQSVSSQADGSALLPPQGTPQPYGGQPPYGMQTLQGMPPQYGPNWQEHAPPPAWPAGMQPPAMTAKQQLEVVADKVGMVPNVRKKDNLMQGAVVGVCLLLGIGISLLFEVSTLYALIGALCGLFVGAMTSGFVLMIAGLKRKI